MSKHIAAFGEVMMRLQVPGYESLAQGRTLNYSFSGTGVNVTSAVARLGHTGYMISTLPKNPIGDAAMSFIQKLGIVPSYISRNGENLGMYFLENGFGVRPSQVTYCNRQESSFNTATTDNYHFQKIAEEIDVIHFCGITLAMNDQVRSQMKSLAKAVKANGGKVVFDCNYRPSLWGEGGYKKAKSHYEEMLHLSDLVMMNEQDAKYILELKTNKLERKEQLIDLLPIVAQTYQIPVIAGTHRVIDSANFHSLQGFMYKDNSFTFAEPVSFQVLDRIGAGDAYTSGILHGEINGFSPEKTVAFATVAAMLAHTVVGDTPTASENDIFQAMNHASLDLKR
ncbi:sugar kinase [Virgibacillus salexigens]|uniref:sugar kinase n=1 Tax=Virgibacillus salexigens TaxID=61016 RepID=UPI00190C33F3|nr:sugar kinase [Virgibacillus salexigens]